MSGSTGTSIYGPGTSPAGLNQLMMPGIGTAATTNPLAPTAAPGATAPQPFQFDPAAAQQWIQQQMQLQQAQQQIQNPQQQAMDTMAAALGVPTQQTAMQQQDPNTYGQPGNTAMWNQVQGLTGAPAPNLGSGGRG